MPDEIQSLILSELQALRNDFNTNARETGERLSALEVGMKSLIGNGQPGRITLLEKSVDKLKEFKWRTVGMAAGVGCIVSFLIQFLVR